jgi:hypothetical protein
MPTGEAIATSSIYVELDDAPCGNETPRYCVVICVVTLLSLAVSEQFSSCRSVRDKRVGTCMGPA